MDQSGSVIKKISRRDIRKRTSREDRIYYTIVNIILFLSLGALIIPILFVIANSMSSAELVATGQVFLWPKEISFEGYQSIFKSSQILTGYGNTIFYTVAGTAISLFLTIAAAWPLSRRDLPGVKILLLFFTFTMIFNGGLIPNYLLVKDIGIINTRFAILLPMALNVYNLIIARTFFRTTIPLELRESAQLDGCSEIRFFTSIVLPLSTALLAVIALFYAVWQWNQFFNAFLYLTDRKLFPLQVILRDILLANKVDTSDFQGVEAFKALNRAEVIKYGLILVACVPIWCVYPFVQRFFVQGVMVGSIKG